MTLNDLQNKKVGIVLSGGGIRGIAHIGILKALHQYQIYPQIISGVSAGALVGALYAKKIRFAEMLFFFKEAPLFKYNYFSINKPGFFDSYKYIPFFEKFFFGDTFEQLTRELHVVATDLYHGTPKFFSKGSLVKPLLASAALPPIFSPVRIRGNYYVDGAIMNNFPIEPLTSCDYIIGSYTDTITISAQSPIKNSYQLATRVNALMLHANCIQKLGFPHLLFRPNDLDKIGILDKKGIEKAFEAGYDDGMRSLESLFL